MSDQQPKLTLTGTLCELGDMEAGRGVCVLLADRREVRLIGLTKDEVMSLGHLFDENVTLTFGESA